MTRSVRVGNYIVVNPGEPRSRWQFPVPGDAPGASCANALDYLLSVCPTTKGAVRKLAEMRRALREATRRPGTGKP